MFGAYNLTDSINNSNDKINIDVIKVKSKIKITTIEEVLYLMKELCRL